jgi:hypothetical protein
MRWLTTGSEVIVVPNDTAYPYADVLAQARSRGAKAVLLQEGIRFVPEKGYTGKPYGTGSATVICAWGQGSKEHLVASGAVGGNIVVTGSPRFDDLEPEAWRDRGRELLERLGVVGEPIALFTNPVETQGFGTRKGKLELFARFLTEAAPLLVARGVSLVVKNHPHEDIRDYERLAGASQLGHRVKVVRSGEVPALLAAARAAVVLTSTVGLEALAFGLPLGVLEIPGYAFGFEYVERGVAAALRLGGISAGLAELLDAPTAREEARRAFLERHLYARGRARENVASAIQALLSA